MSGTGLSVCAVCGLPGRRVLHQLAVAVVGGDDDRAALRARPPRRSCRRPRRPPRPRGWPRRVRRCARPCRGWRSSRGRSRTCRSTTAARTASATAAARHLGLLVVGRDVACGEGIILRSSPIERLLAPAVEEVRHVRVLLGLGAAKLLAARRARRPRGRCRCSVSFGNATGKANVASYVVMHA